MYMRMLNGHAEGKHCEYVHLVHTVNILSFQCGEDTQFEAYFSFSKDLLCFNALARAIAPVEVSRLSLRL